jgi:hypothetical protein
MSGKLCQEKRMIWMKNLTQKMERIGIGKRRRGCRPGGRGPRGYISFSIPAAGAKLLFLFQHR